MEMKIDLTIEDVIDVLSMVQKSVPYTNANDEEADILKRSLNKAIDTMCKYQKIEQIISNFDESSNYYLTLEQIAKVVEE